MTKTEILKRLHDNPKYDFSVFGDTAFEAFYNSKHGTSYHNEPLHSYQAMNLTFQLAWNAFAYAIVIDKQSAKTAWDQYYICAAQGKTYDNKPHAWTYNNLDPSTRLALLSAKEALYKLQMAIDGGPTYH